MPHVSPPLISGTDFNGDGIPDPSMCFETATNCSISHNLVRFMATMTQYPDRTAGILFNTDDMEPLVGIKLRSLPGQHGVFTPHKRPKAHAHRPVHPVTLVAYAGHVQVIPPSVTRGPRH